MTLSAPSVRAATAAPGTEFQEWTNRQVAEWHDKIDQWRLVGQVVLGLTLFTGLVGIGVAALQTSKQKRFRAAGGDALPAIACDRRLQPNGCTEPRGGRETPRRALTVSRRRRDDLGRCVWRAASVPLRGPDPSQGA